jgi:hypothetical protein
MYVCLSANQSGCMLGCVDVCCAGQDARWVLQCCMQNNGVAVLVLPSASQRATRLVAIVGWASCHRIVPTWLCLGDFEKSKIKTRLLVGEGNCTTPSRNAHFPTHRHRPPPTYPAARPAANPPTANPQAIKQRQSSWQSLLTIPTSHHPRQYAPPFATIIRKRDLINQTIKQSNNLSIYSAIHQRTESVQNHGCFK